MRMCRPTRAKTMRRSAISRLGNRVLVRSTAAASSTVTSRSIVLLLVAQAASLAAGVVVAEQPSTGLAVEADAAGSGVSVRSRTRSSRWRARTHDLADVDALVLAGHVGDDDVQPEPSGSVASTNGDDRSTRQPHS